VKAAIHVAQARLPVQLLAAKLLVVGLLYLLGTAGVPGFLSAMCYVILVTAAAIQMLVAAAKAVESWQNRSTR
jgi:hypothetical protein